MGLSFQQKDSLLPIIESERILSLDGNVHGKTYSRPPKSDFRHPNDDQDSLEGRPRSSDSCKLNYPQS